jgi:hypothetical protein
MIPNDVGQQLHHRATTGQPLSVEEQGRLYAWYAQLDEEEGKQLRTEPVQPERIAFLREQVSATLSQIIAVSQQIQAINKENDALRKEVAALHERLARKAS